jgi:hypothetical protein
MQKKLFSTGLAAVLAVVALSAITGTASAAEFGNCLAKGPKGTPCFTGHEFTPFPAATPVAVLPRIVPFSGNLIIANEATPTNAIECTKLSGQGTDTNLGALGHSEEDIAFEGCKGVGSFEICQNTVRNRAQKINGTGKIEGEIEAEATGSEEEQVTLKNGFDVTCAGEGAGETVSFGHITGQLKGALRQVQPWELEFNKTKGLVFDGEPATMTGTSEAVEAYLPSAKVYVSPEAKVEGVP